MLGKGSESLAGKEIKRQSERSGAMNIIIRIDRREGIVDCYCLDIFIVFALVLQSSPLACLANFRYSFLQ